MPNIVITESDFEKLSEATRKELWELLEKQFYPNSKKDFTNLIADISEGVEVRVNLSQKFRSKLKLAKNSAHLDYLSYRDTALSLQKELPSIVKTGIPIKFNVLSLEVAIAVILGLSNDSKKVVEAISQSGTLTRDQLAKILGGSKKINGTIGSINRRLAKRFSKDLYGSNVDKVKLIEYKNELYELTCDSRAIQIAILVEKSGFEVEDGNIILKSPDKKYPSEVKIEAFAIEMAIQGNAYIDDVDWEYEIDSQTISFSVSAARTVTSAIITLETEAGTECVTEEPHFMDARIMGNPFDWLVPPEVHIDENPVSDFWFVEANNLKKKAGEILDKGSMELNNQQGNIGKQFKWIDDPSDGE